LLNIVKDEFTGTYKQGSLIDINATTISNILGFEGDCLDDCDKVTNSWQFTVNGEKCAIWDYKGSQNIAGLFSTYGPSNVFEELFPAHY